jgi:beta subunit of N-acylethanolamine-hydrolyzing acid amidase
MVVTWSHTSGNNTPAPYIDIPAYTLNLDLPPRERWEHIVADYLNLHSIVLSIISQVLDNTVLRFTKPFVKLLWSGILRKLMSDELTEELCGISEVTGCPLWALMAQNIGYDFMVGCSSGGIRAKGENGKEEMFHYRNLVWRK